MQKVQKKSRFFSARHVVNRGVKNKTFVFVADKRNVLPPKAKAAEQETDRQKKKAATTRGFEIQKNSRFHSMI